MNGSQLKLGVNVDHVATIRQARGTSYPSPVDVVPLCLEGGADSITIHLREDRRHIQDADLERLSAGRLLPINLEMANVPEMVGMALQFKPEEVCLVPEKREELTTEGGLDVVGQVDSLSDTVRVLSEAGVSVSLFTDPDTEHVRAATACGAPVIELHTGTYCDAPQEEREKELDRLVGAARLAHELGLQVNAGHGINLDNINALLAIPHMDTLNIGHSIVSRSIFVGFAEAVREMKQAMSEYQGGRIAEVR